MDTSMDFSEDIFKKKLIVYWGCSYLLTLMQRTITITPITQLQNYQVLPVSIVE